MGEAQEPSRRLAGCTLRTRLEAAPPHTGSNQEVKGHIITESLAKVDCTPSLLFQLPGETSEFALGFAKLKQVVHAFGIAPLGVLSDFDEPAQGGRGPRRQPDRRPTGRGERSGTRGPKTIGKGYY